MQHYHDELLTDFGANPHLKKGLFWWFKEIFAPYQPSDYRNIVLGQWQGNKDEPAEPVLPIKSKKSD